MCTFDLLPQRHFLYFNPVLHFHMLFILILFHISVMTCLKPKIIRRSSECRNLGFGGVQSIPWQAVDLTGFFFCSFLSQYKNYTGIIEQLKIGDNKKLSMKIYLQ